jgi:hypothetical protein
MPLRVHISRVSLMGRVAVKAGTMLLSDCRINPMQGTAGSVSRSSASVEGRALTVSGGQAELRNVTLSGHCTHGAIGVDAGILWVIDSVIRDSRASSGGAMLVRNNSTVHVVGSQLVNNSASESGGALQVA